MKKTSGYLHKRGNNFYVSWRFKGKAFLRVLRDENGKLLRPAEAVSDFLDLLANHVQLQLHLSTGHFTGLRRNAGSE